MTSRVGSSTAFSIIVLLGLGLGCGDSVGPIPGDSPQIEVRSATAVPGAVVALRLRNASATEWSYNLCANGGLQRREGDAWVAAPAPFVVCTADLTVLGPGVVRDTQYPVWLGLESGVYRVRIEFRRGDGVVAAPVSNAFLVE